MSILIRNLRKPTDYQKGAMTQDELLKIAIANDANIALARKTQKLGQPPPVPLNESMTANELQQDAGLQESTARKNLEDLGFRPADARSITATLMTDINDVIVFNQVFPAVKNDVSKNYNVKLLTPTAFIDYLQNYLQQVQASKGLSSVSGQAFITDKFNGLVDSINELKSVLPSRSMISKLRARVAPVLARLPPNQARVYEDQLDAMEQTLPDDQLYKAIEQLDINDPARAFVLKQKIQSAVDNLPSQIDYDRIFEVINDRSADLNEKMDALDEAVSSYSLGDDEALRAIREELGLLLASSGQKQSIISSKAIAPDFVIDSPIGKLGKVKFRDAIYIEDATTGNFVRITKGELERLLVALDSDDRFRFDMTDANNKTPNLYALRKYIEGETKQAPSGASMTSGTTSGLTNQSPSGVASLNSALLQSIQQRQGSTKPTKLGVGLRKIGKGIAPPDEPKYIEFGKYVVDGEKLKNKDLFVVKYKSGGNIPSVKPVAVSDIFKEFMGDLLDSEKVNPRIYNQIPVEERMLFEKVAIGAGIFHKLGLKRTTDDKDKKDLERFNLLKGEYLAGNNSLKVIRELRAYVIKFMNDGRIRKNEALNLLMELSE
jgi:hypothetical protein